MVYQLTSRRLSAKISSAVFVIVCGFVLSAPAAAEDLLSVYRKAVANDPQMLSAKYANAAAGELKREALGRMLPRIGFEYAKSYTDQEIVNSDNPFQPIGGENFDTEDFSLTITQPLLSWGLYTGYKQAKAGVLRADAEFAADQQDLILRVAQRYLEALAAQDELGFARAEKAAVKQQLDMVEGRMRSGMARKTELYDARARFARVDAAEISAVSDLDDRLQGLREMIGEIAGPLAPLKAELNLVQPQPQNPDYWIEAAAEQNPRVLLQNYAVEVSKREIDVQRSGYMPTIELTGRINDRDSGGTLFGGGNDVETSDVLLRVNVPLYQGGTVSSRSRRAKHLYQQALQQQTEAQRGVERAARAAYYETSSAISRVTALAASVQAQELALEARRGGYRSGLYTLLDVLDAERDVYEAKRDNARARYDYVLNSLRLKHSIGTISESDVEAINEWLHSADNG